VCSALQHHLNELLSRQSALSQVESVFKFLLVAVQRSDEKLAKYYLLKCILGLTSKLDGNTLYLASDSFKAIFDMSCVLFKEKCAEKGDPLTSELVLLLIEFLVFMTRYIVTHQTMNDLEIVSSFVACL
jgi:hypothetical protein